ncbi:glycosyltransferase family 22 protein [Wolfiporia cocos MD-104 SS10]|uniref:Mannosyltransferase n=1 Tax=Wolfiporia cocos (strain MD-104) TaxID=742152 RepID=A0A2H3J6P3_WOLCO|nr:glycosyltransferase family 22 protein [Wolfiporia cocos MD-104 SS10]
MWTRLLYPPIATTVVATLIIVGLDSIYYQNALWPLILTPLNFLRYNMSTANLAQHGLHPRWLHALVNYPMLIGPLLYYVVAAGMQLVRPPRGVFGSEKPEQEQTPEIRGRDTDSILTITCLSVIVSGIGILSVVPHQEPRFLVPLVIPSIVLVARCGFMRQPSKLFWVSWIVMNALMTPLFGVLHQGGVVPSLFKLHSKVQQARLSEPFDPEFSDAAVNVLYWRTYMPPWHLLSVPEQAVQSGEVALTDLAGAPASEVVDKLRRLAPSTRSYLVAPLYSARIIATDHPECFALEERVFPHLDLDHIVETLELGWRDGLSLGIYSVDTFCLQA